MLILGIDTSSSFLNVCLWEEDKICESFSVDGGLTHSENLIPEIINLLKKANKSIKDLNRVVCTVGPGSFTGIRIGVATANALGQSLGIEVIGISTLQALTSSLNVKNGVIISTMDAQRGSYYTMISSINNRHSLSISDEVVMDIESILEAIRGHDKAYLVGDACKLWKGMPDNIVNTKMLTVDPKIICILGSKMECTSKYIEPVYIRKSQAEVEYEQRNS